MSHTPDPHVPEDDDKIPGYLAWAQFVVTAVILGAIGSLAYMAGLHSSKGHEGGEGAGSTPASVVSADVSSLMTSTPDLVGKGKTLFQVNCVTCHGAGGHGDGAAASALNPKPRNFTSDQGWRFGSGVARIARTLSEGSPGTAMAAFTAIPIQDKIALAHYVRSLNPKPDADKQADLDWLGIGKPSGAPSGAATAAAGGAPAAGPTISIEKAMALLVEAAPKAGVAASVPPEDTGEGAQLYAARCAKCHGASGEGGVRVRMLGSAPYAYVQTRSLADPSTDGANAAAFERHVLQGLPGTMMPGNGDLSRGSLRELFNYTQTLRARQEAAGRGRSS